MLRPYMGGVIRMSARFFFLLAASILIVGCSGGSTPLKVTETVSPTLTPNPQTTTALLPAIPSPTPNITPTPARSSLETSTSVPKKTVSPTITPKATVTLKPSVIVTELQGSPTSLPGMGVIQNCLEEKDYQDSDFVVEDQMIRRYSEGARAFESILFTR